MTRESWTDERLDDLNDKVDRGFERVDRRFDRVEGQISELRKEVNARFDALNRTLLTSAFGLAAALIASRAIPF